MVEIQSCELNARVSALLNNGLRLFALLDYYGYISLVNTIFATRNVECDSYVTFYAEFKNVIRIFLSPIGFV
jgi:hypothetical protein